MKLASLLSLLLFMHAVAHGRDTAYKALRTLGNQRGQSILNRVIEVKGATGTPQPSAWKVVLDDPSARGGVREFEIENGRVASERAPVKTYSGSSEGAVMNFQKLNLDSQGAFTVAEKEASKARVGFDSVDYLLRTDDSSRTPVWILRLLDSNRNAIGTLRIAADDGRVLFRDGFNGRTAPAPGYNPRQPQYTPREPREPREDSSGTRYTRDTGDNDGEQNPNGVGHNIKKGFLKAGASIEEFFTGNRTLDRRYDNE